MKKVVFNPVLAHLSQIICISMLMKKVLCPNTVLSKEHFAHTWTGKK